MTNRPNDICWESLGNACHFECRPDIHLRRFAKHPTPAMPYITEAPVTLDLSRDYETEVAWRCVSCGFIELRREDPLSRLDGARD